MMTRSGLALSTFVAWAVKSVSVVWKVCTVVRGSLKVSLTADWNVSVSDLLYAAFCAYITAALRILGLIASAALMAAGATMATGAETRDTNPPICVIPLAGLGRQS